MIINIKRKTLIINIELQDIFKYNRVDKSEERGQLELFNNMNAGGL